MRNGDKLCVMINHSAPGQESCLWTLIKSEMETFYGQQNTQKEESEVKATFAFKVMFYWISFRPALI